MGLPGGLDGILRTRVFISYSRRDASFVTELLRILLEAGCEAYLDRNDIAPGEDWRGRLDQLILQADAVLFVVTDNSLSSEICGWEVKRTVTLGKRLVPLVNGPLTQQAPAEIAALNYIFSDAPGIGQNPMQTPSTRAIELVRQALDADIAWVREHARLTARAVEWAGQPDDDSKRAKLLRRGEVDAARSWLELRPGPAAPSIPPELIEFLTASEAYETAERDRQRRIIGRGFVKPVQQAVDDSRYDAALRLCATAMALAEDPDLIHVPELWSAVARAVFATRARLIVRGYDDVNTSLPFASKDRQIWSAQFSSDGSRVVTAQWDGTARVWNSETGQEIAVFRGHFYPLFSAVFSPDGAQVVTGGGDETVRIWNAKTGELVAILAGHSGVVDCVAFSPDGAKIVTASGDQAARIWDAFTGIEIAALSGHSGAALGACFSPCGTKVLTHSRDATACVWDAKTGKCALKLRGHLDEVWCAAFNPTGSTIATGSKDGTVRLWQAATGRHLAVFGGYDQGVEKIQFDGEGRRILSVFEDAIRIWDAGSGELLAELRGHEDLVSSACFSPDGGRVLSGSWDNTARLWDAETGAPLILLRGHEDVTVPMGHTNRIRSVSFDADGLRVLTSSDDGTARVWDAACLGQLAIFADHGGGVESAVFSPDGRLVLTAAADGIARVIDVSSGDVVLRLEGHELGLRGAYFSSDASRLVTASQDKTARIWAADNGELVAVLRGHEAEIREAVFSPDMNHILTCSDDETARVWDARTSEELLVLRGHDDGVWSAAYSPDGQFILTGSMDGTARIWRAADGCEIAKFVHSGAAVRACFSGDGKLVVSASENGVAYVWDWAAHKQVLVLNGHDVWVRSAVMSPDQRLLLTSSLDSTVRVWQASTGAELLRIVGHGDEVNSAVFSPDGRRVLTASTDGTACVWDLPGIQAERLGPWACISGALSWPRLAERGISEAADLLMQDAPADLLATLRALKPDGGSSVEEAFAILKEARHKNVYLSPGQLQVQPSGQNMPSNAAGIVATNFRASNGNARVLFGAVLLLCMCVAVMVWIGIAYGLISLEGLLSMDSMFRGADPGVVQPPVPE